MNKKHSIGEEHHEQRVNEQQGKGGYNYREVMRAVVVDHLNSLVLMFVHEIRVSVNDLFTLNNVLIVDYILSWANRFLCSPPSSARKQVSFCGVPR